MGQPAIHNPPQLATAHRALWLAALIPRGLMHGRTLHICGRRGCCNVTPPIY